MADEMKDEIATLRQRVAELEGEVERLRDYKTRTMFAEAENQRLREENAKHLELIRDLYECAKCGQWLLFCTESCGRGEETGCNGLFDKLHYYLEALAGGEAGNNEHDDTSGF